ncbi:MAG: lactonase family protein [candidate division KSB1 bacterium]|nr:lactonase family protein [candidate division KSB1 bacterium]MDZ7304083.1 lactonase family protein [candidate division KSB1 bacterium]MDZ7312063.1 lactonase family protein [candidate division KSB1 bacterium]
MIQDDFKPRMKWKRINHQTSLALMWTPIHIMLLASLLFAQDARFISYIADTNLDYAIICSPDGKNVYASGAYTIAVFARGEGDTLTTIQVLNNDHLGVKDIHNVIDLAISPDGRYLYAVTNNDQSLLLFSRDTINGVITLREVIRDSVFGRGRGGEPSVEHNYKLLISPDGRYLYWLFSGNGLLAAFSRDLYTGQLTKIQVLGNGAAELGASMFPGGLLYRQTVDVFMVAGAMEPRC